MNLTDQNWAVHYEPDPFDSARSTLRVIDAGNASRTHPQGPVTIAAVNVVPFAPHLEQPQATAAAVAATPQLLGALQHVAQAYDRATDFTQFMDALDWKRIRAALNQAHTLPELD